MKYMRRGSGYYIDVGASDLIAAGEIKLEDGVEIDRLTETGVVLKDGTGCRPTSSSMRRATAR